MAFFDFLTGKNPAADQAKLAANQIDSVNIPDIESLKVKLQQLVQQGVLTPEAAQAYLVQNNAYDQAGGNAQAQGAQQAALQELQDRYDQGGLTATDRSQLQQVRDDSNVYQHGQDQAIMTDAARRGVSGSGMELASRLMAQQSAANQEGRGDLTVAANAEQAKMKALEDAANLGGQMEQQTFSEQGQKAAAANAIAQFNATNQTQVNMANTAAKNAAQATNLGETQRIADTNAGLNNANSIRNADLITQNYNQRMDKAKSQAAALNGVGAAEEAKQGQDAALFGGLLGTAGTLGASYMTPKKAPGLAHGGRVGGPVEVPGQAPVAGDDTRNDIVPANLSPGELVVPRTQADDVEQFMGTLPRTQNKPSVEAIKTVLQALTEMGA